jgi:ketosteroid isomerase-like protein
MKFNKIKSAILCGSLFFVSLVQGQNNSPKEEIIKSMEDGAADWNKGDLDDYVALYDSSATMMTRDGRIGLDGIRQVFVKYYFDGKMPKQQLSYDHYELTMLGENYALLTGRFILKASSSLPERTGIFSVILVHRPGGWKLVHDHSG